MLHFSTWLRSVAFVALVAEFVDLLRNFNKTRKTLKSYYILKTTTNVAKDFVINQHISCENSYL